MQLPGLLVAAFLVGASCTGIVSLAYFAAFGFGHATADASILIAFAQMPGLARSILQTLLIGIAGTAIGVVLALLLPAGRVTRQIGASLAPVLLAVPHLSMAVALAFVLSPSGWIMRLLSPWATGYERPPVGFGGEAEAMALLGFGLVVKELPFLLLVAFGQLRQLDEARLLRLGQTLGYGRFEAWLKLVLPLLYRRMGPAIIAVLIFAIANVEMALPLGPSHPPTLAVMALDLLGDPEPMQARLGAMAALVLIGLGLLAIAIWRGIEWIIGNAGRRWLLAGPGSLATPGLILVSWVGHGIVVLAAMAGFAVLCLWSVAGAWRFPDSLPASIDWQRFGDRMTGLLDPAWTTIWLAATSVTLAMLLAVLWLEYRAARPLPVWLYLPLLIPQIAILAGLNFILLKLGFGISLWGVIAGHTLFVLPYVILVLGDGFHALDPRFARTARSLGHNRLAVLWRIKLPLLRSSLTTAAAIGFAVSVALYLPTIFAGGGRLSTLATEVIALSHGGDRRAMAAAGLMLAILPLLALLAAQAAGRPVRR